MSVPAVRQIAAPSAPLTQPAQSGLAAVDSAEAMAATASPARVLQERLQTNIWGAADVVEFEGKRWPLYLALPFWLAISGLLWAAIITSVLALFHHH